MDGLEPEVKRIAQLIYDGKLKAGQIDKGMTKKIAQQLMQGIFKGFGKTLDSKNLTAEERSFLTRLNTNVYVFSGFKNYQQLRETTLLLKNDEGKLKPFHEFLADVKEVNHTYNEVYLNAEYGNAVASAQAAATWTDYTSNGIEMLTYVTAGDDRVREEHAILEGATYPIDHEFWDTYFPPNDWGCRCDTQPAVGAQQDHIPASELPDLPVMFQNNVGKSGVAFPDTHPYFKTNEADKKKILEQVAEILPPDRSVTVHYESPAGGIVEKENSVNKNELKENTAIANFLADLKHNVKLLGVDDTPGVRNPDALIDGVKFEFKTNSTPTKSAIDNELRAAKNQADHILLNIKSDIKPEELSDAINDRARRSKKVNAVWVIYEHRLIKLDRKILADRGAILLKIKKSD